MSRRAPALLLISAISLSLTACKHDAAPPDDNVAATANIKVATVHLQRDEAFLNIPGRVEADPSHVVHIYAPLSGRLLEMKLSPGQEVRKGQSVGTLQSGDVAQARSDFEKARIEVLRADRALTRGKLLFAHEVMSQADLQELQAVDEASHSEQERSRQRIHELGFSENGSSDTTAITSPISGTVLAIGTSSGEMQRSLETTNGIATVANLDTIWVTGDLFEQDLGAVHPHDAVTVLLAAYPNETFHGTVANIGDAFDPATHALKVRVVLANSGHRLKPDMYATLQIARPAVNRIVVPQAAVLHEGNGTEVYVPAPGRKFITRKVTIGTISGDKVEITSGLHDGDQVVVEGAGFLRTPVGD